MRGSDLLRRREEAERKPPTPTGLAPLDRLLNGGFLRGALTEITGPRSSGRFSLALTALATATCMGESAALIDMGDHLDPAAATEAGVDLARLLWVRPRGFKDAAMSAEMVIGTGFGFVILDVGAECGEGGTFPMGSVAAEPPRAVWTRLARAAEAQNSTLLLITERPLAGGAARAALHMDAAPRWRGTETGRPVIAGLATTLRLLRRDAPPGAAETLSLSQREAVAW